ncbi:uncharacterized protein LOC132737545 [Ruditapes philippinarum]|uniref:uncharacterized protein LOC132737545 n=1 Tax=Ruditapes philippinarum TaxID=129788 RepID=UPI00295AD274|nr:uncharacterized protein LOC132737545 [Ruditapes philippinarum]
MVKCRSEYKKLLRTCRFEYDKQKTSNFENNKLKNARLYWNMLKESAGLKPAEIPLSNFEHYFRAVNNPADRFFVPDDDILEFNSRYRDEEFKVMFQELNVIITEYEIKQAINQLKRNRSAGPDLLLNEFLISGKDVFIPLLCVLFNKIFETGNFPDRWSEGYVIPLHKKGGVNEVENYRGITLLSSLGKLFSSVINTRLKNWAEKYNVYIEAQAFLDQI